MVVQRLLCRWWYAIEWPKLDEIGIPPPGYEALEGYVGVFVSTRVSAYVYVDVYMRMYICAHA